MIKLNLGCGKFKKKGYLNVDWDASVNPDCIWNLNSSIPMSDDYVDRHTHEEIVRDFIAGMTDQYFLRQCPQDMRPSPQLT